MKMLVHEVMTPLVVSAGQNDPAARAARLLSRHNIGILPVLGEKGELRGIVTDRDLVLRCVALENAPETTPLKDVMSRCVITVSPGETVEEAVKKMTAAQIRRLPVTDSGRLVGMLSLSDISKAASCTALVSSALSEISSNIHRLT